MISTLPWASLLTDCENARRPSTSWHSATTHISALFSFRCKQLQ